MISLPAGAMGLEYSEARLRRRALRYRLRRRADEVVRAIRAHFPGEPSDLLDVGAADGRSLSLVQNALTETRITGLEVTPELVDACQDGRLKMIEGDAMSTPFESASFDIVTATAVIEHVASPRALLERMHEVLRPRGLIVVTTPDPLFERIAGWLRHLDDEAHNETITLNTLRCYLEQAGFEVIEATRFMCWPWGHPGERHLERWMRRLGLGRLLLNQLAVGRRG